MKRIFLIDIDGTICENVRNEEGIDRMRLAKPFDDSIRAVNRLYGEGHFICLFTARTDAHRNVTEEWLARNGVKFHQIVFNKPRKIGEFTEYHFIDDTHSRATTFKGKFTRFITKKAEIETFEE
jgi:uncharacterized HAD superfamily protein